MFSRENRRDASAIKSKYVRQLFAISSARARILSGNGGNAIVVNTPASIQTESDTDSRGGAVLVAIACTV